MHPDGDWAAVIMAVYYGVPALLVATWVLGCCAGDPPDGVRERFLRDGRRRARQRARFGTTPIQTRMARNLHRAIDL